MRKCIMCAVLLSFNAHYKDGAEGAYVTYRGVKGTPVPLLT